MLRNNEKTEILVLLVFLFVDRDSSDFYAIMSKVSLLECLIEKIICFGQMLRCDFSSFL